jgi:sporulation protein YlmC with PRC-barrel domain
MRSLAITLTCCVVGLLSFATSASAASQAFLVTNDTGMTLRLDGISRVTGCNNERCQMQFEGRPEVGAKLPPEAIHDFELVRHASWTLAALLSYQVLDREGKVVGQVNFTIRTKPYDSDVSSCWVEKLSTDCHADGTNLSFGNPPAAGGASRGFMLRNRSAGVDLKLVDARPYDTGPCHGGCSIGFEGRPRTGAELPAGAIHDWELKYSFFGQYGALLTYDILDGDGRSVGRVHYTIETNPFTNNSSCTVTRARDKCTAEGLSLSFTAG